MTDTLAYSKRLQEAGVPAAQAEAHASAAYALRETLARGGVGSSGLRDEVAGLRRDLAAFERRLVVKLGVLMVVVAALALAIDRLL